MLDQVRKAMGFSPEITCLSCLHGTACHMTVCHHDQNLWGALGLSGTFRPQTLRWKNCSEDGFEDYSEINPTEEVSTIQQVRIGDRIDTLTLGEELLASGFRRVGSVREIGEFAIRGDIFDIFPAGTQYPCRLDFFGDELEGIRIFDPMSQQTVKGVVPSEITLCAVTEVVLDDATISYFRSRYRVMFGVSGDDDPLYTRFHPVSGFLGSSIGFQCFRKYGKPI